MSESQNSPNFLRTHLLRIVVLSAMAIGFLTFLEPTNTPLAQAAASSIFSQCRNEITANTLGVCAWTGGILNSQNSKYTEGMGTLQRLGFANITGPGTHTITFQYQATDTITGGTAHGYDFLVSWAQADALSTQYIGVPFTRNQCGGLNSSQETACNNLIAADIKTDFNSFAAGGDTFVSAAGGTYQSRMDAFGTTYTTPTIRLYSVCPFSSGPTVTSLSHITPQGIVLPNGGDTGLSDVKITITYSTTTGTDPNCPSSGANIGVSPYVMLQFAGHLALGNGQAIGWPSGKGAGAITGGGWHIRNPSLDGCCGSEDNQIAVGAPTAADLSGFEAIWNQATAQVDLAWESATEYNVIGYNVWRKRGKGNWRQLNAEIIPAQNPGSLTGAAYEYADSAVKAGKMHKYRVEVVHTDGSTSKSDKVKVKVPKE